jgi:predicted signal transduction protein with EAL and GGDEF domain
VRRARASQAGQGSDNVPAMPGGEEDRRKRPLSVTLVALLALGVAVYSTVYGVVILEGGEADRRADGVFHLALGVGALVACVGALRLRPWAWALFMTWAVVGLTHQILRYLFFGDPTYADMAINTFTVLALSPLEVQIAFGLRHTENVELARPTRNPLDNH